MTDIQIRPAKQTCFCRACDKKIEPHSEKIITFYSHRNCGQNIHICVPCVKKFNELILDDARGKTSKLYNKKEIDDETSEAYNTGYSDGEENFYGENWDGHFIR